MQIKMSYRDAVSRIVWTFLQASLAALVVAPALDVSAAKAAAFVGLTAVIAVIKNIAATRVGELDAIE